MEQRLELDPETFLAEYWQREPLVLSQAVTDFKPPVDADTLAGAALEDGVDARILTSDDGEWKQLQGPFRPVDFERTGSWTLLVQEIDQLWEEAADLLQLVGFLPNWRLSDVMMSYATDGASAGPHFDLYDVFIIQGEGERVWQLGQRCDEATKLLPNQDLKILHSFKCEEEHVLRCGDLLYIPPGVAHWGVSRGESTSYSIGCRAPRISDLLARATDYLLDDISPSLLWADPKRSMGRVSGQISDHDVSLLREQLSTCLEHLSVSALGEVVTGSLSHRAGEPDGEDAIDSIDFSVDGELRLDRPSSIAWYRDEGQLLVFANGETITAPATAEPVIRALCSGKGVRTDEVQKLDSRSRATVKQALQLQALVFHSSDDIHE
ncbi:MAG: cupin domain-containing protein [Pseudomonadota bacterium]